MNFAGKWKCVKRENIREMYTHMGVPNDQVESFASVETQMEMEQTGKKIKEKYCMGAMEMDVSFTIDEESHVKNWDGTPLITTPKSLGENKFKFEYDYKGVHYIVVRELTNPNTIVDILNLDHGKVVGKYEFSRI